MQRGMISRAGAPKAENAGMLTAVRLPVALGSGGMSRKDEDRILHGLHYYRESIDDDFPVTGDQILWLASHSYAEAGSWLKDGELQSVDSSVIPEQLRRKLLLSKFEVPMRYLHYRRLIKLTVAGADTVDVAVTFAGADRAMRLHTRTGRLEVWFQEHKDGFIGLVLTLAVSLATSVATIAVWERLHRGPVEAPRVIYEVVPKPAS
jgi:hypothetical protein